MKTLRTLIAVSLLVNPFFHCKADNNTGMLTVLRPYLIGATVGIVGYKTVSLAWNHRKNAQEQAQNTNALQAIHNHTNALLDSEGWQEKIDELLAEKAQRQSRANNVLHGRNILQVQEDIKKIAAEFAEKIKPFEDKRNQILKEPQEALLKILKQGYIKSGLTINDTPVLVENPFLRLYLQEKSIAEISLKDVTRAYCGITTVIEFHSNMTKPEKKWVILSNLWTDLDENEVYRKAAQ